MVLDKPFTTSSPALINYDYNDINRGFGFKTHYPNISINDTETEYILNDIALPTSTTTGLLITKNSYKFKTSINQLPRTISGTATLSGYADFNADNMTIAGQISILKEGTAVDGGLGVVVASNASEIDHSSGTGYVLIKTIWVNDYVNKVTGNYWTSDGGVSSCAVRVVLKHFDGVASETLSTSATTETSPQPYTLSTATPLVRVSEVEIWTTGSSGGANVSEGATQVYANIVTGTSETVITDLITSETHTQDSGFLLLLPTTEAILSSDEKIVLSIRKTGTTGGYVLDPTNIIHTEETLKLNIPFKLDL